MWRNSVRRDFFPAGCCRAATAQASNADILIFAGMMPLAPFQHNSRRTVLVFRRTIHDAAGADNDPPGEAVVEI
jgi:hypothetical protein